MWYIVCLFVVLYKGEGTGLGYVSVVDGMKVTWPTRLHYTLDS